MLGKTLLLTLFLVNAFSAHGTEVRTARTIVLIHILVCDGIFFATVLIGGCNIGFAADKILIGKVDKVGIKKNNFCLFLCLFGAFGINGNGLFIVSCECYIILLLLWSSVFVTLMAKKYHKSITLNAEFRTGYDNR